MNNLPELKECLEGLQRQMLNDFRVIICVDGSTDGTNEFLNTARFKFEFLKLNHPDNVNKGRDETRNLALPYLNSEYLLLIDSDIIPSEDLIKNHFDLLSGKDCISVGQVLYNDSSKNLWSFYLQTRGKGKYRHLQEMPAYYLNTQNVAFKTKYFSEIGGQDSDLSSSYGGDDTVLGYRIWKKFKIPAVFNKAAAAYCKHEKQLDKALVQLKEFGNGNLKIIKNKYPELNRIFRLNLMDSESWHHKLFRMILNEKISGVILKMLRAAPSPVNLWMIQFLVFNSIYQGYRSENKK